MADQTAAASPEPEPTEAEAADALKELEKELAPPAPVAGPTPEASATEPSESEATTAAALEAAGAATQAAATAAAAPAPVRKKREGGKRAKGEAPPAAARAGFKEKLTELRGKVTELFGSLRSEDQPTRRMAAYFFLSLAGMAFVLGVATERYLRHARELSSKADRVARRENAALEEFLKKRSEMARRKNSILVLGQYSFDLKTEEGGRQPASMSVADLEITIECDGPDSRAFLEEHMTQAQNEVTSTFVNISREQLMSPEGKNKLKRILRNRLNILLPSGRVENVFISQLILS